ncbi:MAG: tRNA (guanosine(37)-N1)-methyltransferase TrmD [Candidatus Pacebacteria bacterium]|nr:tRNA (guanosine(37)-N1)-methyltransferase TrmD [Candidatus Paceibacterota bacterium]
MEIVIFTLFPEFFKGPFEASILGKANTDKQLLKVVNIRDFATDKHKVTDDRPYGGGPGMVMKVEPIDLALSAHSFKKGTVDEKIILTSAQGGVYTQETAKNFAQLKRIAIICGHYEGVDERITENLIDEELRIGDYVMTGGEPAAIVIVDSVVRLLPGVLGNEASNQGESHDQPGQLGFPQYTRPEVYKNWSVPEVLLTGDHKKIVAWRESKRKKSN